MFQSRLFRDSLPDCGDVVYAPGWSFCYRIVSGPFCRVHYVKWRGLLACAPLDSPAYYSYLVQALGGERINRLLVRK